MDQISTWFDKDSIRARVGEGVRVRLKLIIAFAVSLGFLEVTIVIAGASDEQGGRARVLRVGDSVFDAFDHVASAREQLDSRQEMPSTQRVPRLGVESSTLTQFTMSLSKNKILVDDRDFQRVQEAISFDI